MMCKVECGQPSSVRTLRTAHKNKTLLRVRMKLHISFVLEQRTNHDDNPQYSWIRTSVRCCSCSHAKLVGADSDVDCANASRATIIPYPLNNAQVSPTISRSRR